MIGVVWYLETSMANGTLKDVGDRLHNDIRGRYGNAFTSVFSKGRNLTNQAHSGMHQLAKIAQYHFMSEQSSSLPTVKAIEAPRTVQFYVDEFGESPVGVQKRKPDIILEPSGATGNEIWIELKSFTHKRNFSVWKYSSSGKGGGTVGKEIIVDRAAKVRAASKGVWEGENKAKSIKSVDIRWRFQEFNVKAKGARKAARSYTKAEFDKVLEKLSKIDDKSKEIKTTLKISGKDNFKAGSIAKLDTIMVWLTDNAGDIFESLNLADDLN